MINIALIQPGIVQDWEKGSIERLQNLVNKNCEINRFNLVNDAKDADLVVLLDSCIFKTQKNIKDFENILYYNEGKRRLCTLNYEDSPAGFLPGVYSSLEAYRFDPAIHISWPHLIVPNEQINEARLNKEPDAITLFTFSGSSSSPIRRKIFNLYRDNTSKYKVKEIKKWYNHTESEKRSYIDDIRQSKFVLCPNGLASYSHRITETLALGKVPVVIADNWMPFSIPEKNYFIAVKEDDVSNLIQILEQKEDEYEKLRANAVYVYSKYFEPRVGYSVALNQLTDLYTNQLLNISADFLRDRWHSRKFWKNNNWCIEDRVIRKIKRIIE